MLWFVITYLGSRYIKKITWGGWVITRTVSSLIAFIWTAWPSLPLTPISIDGNSGITIFAQKPFFTNTLKGLFTIAIDTAPWGQTFWASISWPSWSTPTLLRLQAHSLNVRKVNQWMMTFFKSFTINYDKYRFLHVQDGNFPCKLVLCKISPQNHHNKRIQKDYWCRFHIHNLDLEYNLHK